MDNSKVRSQGFEENTMALLDSSGIKDSRDIHDDRIAFLEAVRSSYLDCDSNRPPSWNMYDATFKMLRGSKSLELVISSFQLLTELNKKFPRTYLLNEAESPGIFVNNEAWSPFVLGTESIHVEGSKITTDLLDPAGFASLVDGIAQDFNHTGFELGIEPLQNMLLFQYLVEVLEADFITRQILYKESLNWILFRESMLNMLLGSRKIHHKNLVKTCMAIIIRRSYHQILEEDCKMSTDEFNVPLATALKEVKRKMNIDMKKFLTLIMDLDLVRRQADSLGATSRIDGTRSSALEIILDELTYNIHDLSPFLMAFSEPKWKLEVILQYLSKYCMKASVRTRRANIPNEITVDSVLSNFSTTVNTKTIAKKISSGIFQMLLAHLFQACLSIQEDNCTDNSTKKIGNTLSEISKKFVFAIQNLRKSEEGLEIVSFVKEALFTATLLAGKIGNDDMLIQ
ncbi:negative regulator of systemic acquired resistance (SNI1) [Rhynchospora pubera]|uniref:Negative regulator of systemic acquired resistance (SNI1) n=1 Tax=Rhynchospora pubera TaxID=906938 RepID=A0AAV8DQL1_9POAL|nr:negative regulator of systemic acquired resistance (SNI1) [Rhynchospora pubera]